MSSKTLCAMVRTAVIAAAVCGLAVCCYFLPALGADIAKNNPEFAYCYLPWLLFLLAASLPCFAILGLVWIVSVAINKEQVFTVRTARIVKMSAILLLCDVGFFFCGNIAFLLLDMSHPSVLLISLFVDVFGVSLALLAAVLSRYLTKAAVLQEEADGTI